MDGVNGSDGMPTNSGKTSDGDLHIPKLGKRSRNNDDIIQTRDDAVMSSSRASGLRARKRSKYSSYPYVDSSLIPDLPLKSTLHPVNAAINIDAPSTELLDELQSTALDCFYINNSKFSDSLWNFFSSFRISSFLDTNKSIEVLSRELREKATAAEMGGTKEEKASIKRRGKLPMSRPERASENFVSQNSSEAPEETPPPPPIANPTSLNKLLADIILQNVIDMKRNFENPNNKISNWVRIDLLNLINDFLNKSSNVRS